MVGSTLLVSSFEHSPSFFTYYDYVKLKKSICFVFTSFVRAMVEYFYPSDSDVQKDTELQDWISEIFTHGVLENKTSGI